MEYILPVKIFKLLAALRRFLSPLTSRACGVQLLPLTRVEDCNLDGDWDWDCDCEWNWDWEEVAACLPVACCLLPVAWSPQFQLQLFSPYGQIDADTHAHTHTGRQICMHTHKQSQSFLRPNLIATTTTTTTTFGMKCRKLATVHESRCQVDRGEWGGGGECWNGLGRKSLTAAAVPPPSGSFNNCRILCLSVYRVAFLIIILLLLFVPYTL